MFVGHMAVALVAKTRAPRVSLGTFVASAFALDLLWPVFLLLGIEQVRIDPGNTKFTPLAFDCYPWSHSLVMAIGWGVAGSILVRWRKGDSQSQLLVFALVVSHWVLDLVSHRPDLPLWPGNSPRFGLGLWNSVPGTLALEGMMFLFGVWFYLRRTTRRDSIGIAGFWLLILFSTFVWVCQPWSPPPPNPRFLAWFGLGSWLLPIWAAWVDHHRIAQSI